MSWIYYVLAAALALAAADILVKSASGKIPDSVGMLLYGTVPFVTGLIWSLAERRNAGFLEHITARGLLYGIGVGVMYSTVTFCMYAAFRAHAPLSLASPLVRLGGLLVAGMAGLIFWREALTVRYSAGLILVCAGMYLMITR